MKLNLMTPANPIEALQIGLWIIGATAVLQAVAAAFSIIRAVVNRAERREMTLNAEAVPRPDFDVQIAENKHEHENIHARLGGVERGITSHLNGEIRALREERREDISALHGELNEVARKVSSLEATNTLQSQRLAEINAKLDRVIERQKHPAAP